MGQAHEKSAKRYNSRSRAREKNYKTGGIVRRTNFRLADATKQYAAKLSDRHVKCRIVDRIGVGYKTLKKEATLEYSAQRIFLPGEALDADLYRMMTVINCHTNDVEGRSNSGFHVN
jgi:hypothetical protein